MRSKKFFIVYSACMFKSRSILSKRQRLRILMMLLSTPAQRRSMAIAARREQAEMLLDLNVREGPSNVTEVSNVLDM